MYRDEGLHSALDQSAKDQIADQSHDQDTLAGAIIVLVVSCFG